MLKSSDTIPVNPTISFIIPTHGRSTLQVLLNELVKQVRWGDEIIVVADGPQPVSTFICALLPNISYERTPQTNKWGLAQLDRGSEIAKGDFLSFCGDDDHILPDTVQPMRAALASLPVGLHLFSMKYENRVLGGSLEAGYVSGHQIVIPNIKEKLALWTADDGEASDYHYIQNSLKNWGGEMHMHDLQVYWLEKRNHGKVF